MSAAASRAAEAARAGIRLPGMAQSFGIPLLLFAAIVALLEWLKDSGHLPITVPAPSQVAEAFLQSYGDLLYHMGPTVLGAVLGYALAISIALALAAIATSVRGAEPPIFRIGVAIDSIPLIALTPILMVWVGNGLSSRIAIATIASLFPLIVGSIRGFRAVEQNASELFHVLSASRGQAMVKLALPSALPYLFAAFKIAAPLAILGSLIAEWVSADRGLGIMMVYALFSFNVPLAWLTILAVCALAALAYGLVAGIERLVVGAGSGERLHSDG